MKLFYLVVLLGAFFIPLNAQKHEFGFLLRAGNYALPQQKTLPGYKVGAPNSQLVVSQKAGESYSLGFWGSTPIRGQFRLSSEFTFNIFRFTHVREHRTDYPINSSYADGQFLEHHKMVGFSVSLPIKFYYFFNKNDKWALSLGAGASHLVSTSNQYLGHAQVEGFPASSHTSFRHYSDWDEFNTTINLNAGVHYQFDINTSVGIEYIIEKSGSEDLFAYYPDYVFCDCNCGCDGYYSRPRPNINSFSVSLRHNILR